MPDLNLIDDEPSGEETLAPESASSAAKGGGGGSLRMVIILALLVLIIAGLVYVLNSRGIIRLWGKPTQSVVQVPDEQYPPDQFNEETFAEQPVDTMAAAQAGEEMAMLETTPLDEAAPTSEAAPAKEQPKSEAGSLKDMKGDYTIQVVAFREKEKADDVFQNLEFAGYPAFVEKVPMKGGDWYTVRIGRYPTRQEAKTAVASFAEQIRSNYVIDRIRSK